MLSGRPIVREKTAKDGRPRTLLVLYRQGHPAAAIAMDVMVYEP